MFKITISTTSYNNIQQHYAVLHCVHKVLSRCQHKTPNFTMYCIEIQNVLPFLHRSFI